MIKIGHYADIQVKVRDNELHKNSYEANLMDIENNIESEGINIVVAAGDLWEFYDVNDIERLLMYSHIANILMKPNVKEFVIMLGNHDLPSEKKVKEITRTNNPLDTLHKFLNEISPELSNKLNYLKLQEPTVSKAYPDKLVWLPYSLEDGKSNGNKIREYINNVGLDESKKYITIYHDILIEYVDESGLPINDTTRKRLANMSMFFTDEIFAGDIHENWKCEVDNKKFWYTGSTQQRNYGEGCYLTIYHNKFNYEPADIKNILVHTYDDDFVYQTTHYVPLVDYIKHITIDITNTLSKSTSEKRSDIVELIGEQLSKIEFGTYQTFIKVKSSNVYLDEEINIINTIKNISDKMEGITEIEPISYEKIINNKIAETNKVIEVLKTIETDEDLTEEEIKAREIINLDNIENLTTEHITENFENVLLNKPKLIKLFKSLIEVERGELIKILPPDINIETVIQEIVNLFISEIEFAIDSTPNYKLKLKTIQTTGFMPLGENFINLDIPGLARIDATNRRGKTTLYTMIYWTIRGKIYEFLKDNQVVKNNLHIFNDEKPDNDSVINLLKIEVNGVPISIKRYAIRKWKSKVTDEQKSSIEWRNYISGVQTDVEVSFVNKGIEVKKTGIEAQDLINSWFGKVPETILFLNQAKINSLLNYNSDDLQKLTLDYIGIDYIKTLVDNLPNIKDHMGVIKPKRTKAAIKFELEELEKTNNFEERTKEVTENISKEEDAILINNNKTTKINNEIVDLGNVPLKIKNFEDKLSVIKYDIDNFEVREPKELPVFNEVEPIKNVDKEAQLIKEVQKIEKDLANYKSNKIELKNKLDDYIKNSETVINNTKIQLTDLKVTIVDKWKNKINEDLDIANTLLTDNSKLLLNKLSIVEDDINQTRDIINKVDLNVNMLNKQINEDEQNIKNTICSECGKPLSENPEEHKKYIDDKQLIIDNNKIKVDKLIKLGNVNKIKVDELNNFKVLLRTVHDFKNSQIVEPYFTMESTLNSINLSKELLSESKAIILVYLQANDNINNLNNKLNNLINNIPDEEDAKKLINIDNKIIELDKLKLNIIKLNFDEETIVFGDIVLKNDNLNYHLINTNNLIIEQDKLIESNSNELLVKQKELKTFIDNFNTDYRNYQTNYNKHLLDYNKCVEFNNSVKDHNHKINDLKVENVRVGFELEDEKRKLDNYNNLTQLNVELETELRELYTKLKSLREIETQIKVDIQKYENNIESINKEYLEYIEYEKNKAKYSIYELIVSKKFKIAVFAYYRNFLNITFNILLQDLNFKLFWNEDGNLYYIKFENGKQFTRPVQLVSGMETCFLGLALTYAIHTLNVKNNISHLFIDEISGQLNDGKSESSEVINPINYQEQLLSLLNKFESKSIFIIDHVIKDMFQTVTYTIDRKDNASYYHES